MPTILHLDRSKFYHKIIKEIAVSKNFGYVSSQTSEEAFKLLEENEIDLIITGKELEHSSGEEFVRDLNASRFKDIPVIVITSEDSQETQERFFSLGIINYLLKSEITVERLSRYLDQFIVKDPMVEELKKATFAVLDDSRISIKAITSILRSRGIENVDTFEDPVKLLEEQRLYDVYFIDVIMPRMSGEEVVLELRRRCPNCVIIIISAINSIKTMTHILNSGADDYIMKPFEAELTIARLKANIRTLQILRELELKSAELERLAVIDGLTGAYNHRHLLKRLDAELEKAKRYHRALSILLLDIDHFKLVNDNYGHLTGDEALRQFTTVITNQSRDVDIFGRYGGEEFVLIMPETSERDAGTLAERIRAAISSHSFPGVEGSITVSGGLVQFQGEESSALIKEADRRLYLAKKQGRNRIVGS